MKTFVDKSKTLLPHRVEFCCDKMAAELLYTNKARTLGQMLVRLDAKGISPPLGMGGKLIQFCPFCGDEASVVDEVKK